MTDPFDLQRFVDAQDRVIDQVLGELRQGRKTSHWMWFVFPQIRGLGFSPMAERYAIGSLDEARAYLRHPVLGPRLTTCTDIVNGIGGRSIHAIFGAPDDLKFHACMTLFDAVSDRGEPFRGALDLYFAGEPHRTTLELSGAPPPEADYRNR
jgi:uncharacterized protein (DUF1810 family)